MSLAKNKLQKVIVILGPTASGKSEIAIKLAQEFGGEIISADSRQVYRGLDVGTGKVTKAQQKMARHWLIDVVSPRTDYNVSHFKRDAGKTIKNIIFRGKLPVICGGTGFWISTLVDNIQLPDVKPDKKFRESLEKYSAQKLHLMLENCDPQRARTIDKNNKVRLIRAIEICKTLSKVPRNTRCDIRNTKYDFLRIGIQWSKETQDERIRRNLRRRFKCGMAAEVKRLRKEGISWKRLESFGLGYYWISLCIRGKISKKDLFGKVYRSEKDYSKRQRTWFKRDKRIVWLNKYADIRKGVRGFI